MKKSSLIVLAAFLFVSYSMVNAQIRVDTDGDVTIGATTVATKDLDVVGNTYFNGNVGVGSPPSSTYLLQAGPLGTCTSLALRVNGFTWFFSYYYGIKIDAGPSYDLEMYPDANNYCNIGRTDKAFRSVYAYNYPTPSDKRQKENIKEIDNALGLISQLNGVKYDLKKEFAYIDSIPMSSKEIEKLEKQRKDIYGFIAQDVGKILPSVMSYDDSTDTYALDYTKITPVLVSAIKEQQIIIEEMQAEIAELQGSNLKSLALSGDMDLEVSNKSLLHQNEPNPFGETTSIRYNLPEGTTNADIIIYDMTGKQLRRIPLSEDGEASIQVHGGEMYPGMYMYSMIVENQLVDTKQMIITE